MRIRVRVNGVEGGATLSIGAEAGVKTESELVAAAATKLLGVDPTQSIDVSKAKLFLSVPALTGQRRSWRAKQLRLLPGLSPLP